MKVFSTFLIFKIREWGKRIRSNYICDFSRLWYSNQIRFSCTSHWTSRLVNVRLVPYRQLVKVLSFRRDLFGSENESEVWKKSKAAHLGIRSRCGEGERLSSFTALLSGDICPPVLTRHSQANGLWEIRVHGSLEETLLPQGECGLGSVDGSYLRTIPPQQLPPR